MMELAVGKISFSSLPKVNVKPQEQRRRPSSLVASRAIAAAVVGPAVTILAKRTKASEEAEAPMQICEACRGSGICPECKGEGFVLKKLSDESAERARLASKNMATRYRGGYTFFCILLPKVIRY
ncbi:hypothetical protein D8674_006390 [Pyrus ussuriensis x Pyrus communis]|uniref:DUF7895 domain-containing protein n=1 Tax=Pyrus ussuriensis x Pyrus communis TaxID=2448454 RepID=A0A5N5FUF6_9ROSA|nr:hypothetical protein D8674_006390 [Pyrus ussuriensis x Pyrus communis]